MATTVDGSCAEPGGMELDDDCYECECPNCRAVAIKCDWEIVEGGCMNAYWSVSCSACGYADGVYPDSEDDYDDHDYDAESAARRAEIDAQIQAWIEADDAEADDAEDAWHFLAPLLMQKTDFLTLLNACNAQRQC